MSNEELRKAGENLAAALEKFSAGMEHTGHILTAQAAMGWIYRGDLAAARRSLRKLPPEKLAEVSTAAAALSSLADEVAAAKS